MLGKVPGNIEAIRPMKDGVIADFVITEQMIKQFIKMVHPRSVLAPSPRIIICVPCGSTQVERRAIRDAALGAGASSVPDRGTDGRRDRRRPAGVEASGSMVVDIGGGTTEVGVISLGGMVYKGSVRVGGDKFDEAIINYIRRNYGMLIGEPTPRPSRRASARLPRLRGQGDGSQGPQPVRRRAALHHLVQRDPGSPDRPLNQIVSAVKNALEQTRPAGRRHRRARHDADRRRRAAARPGPPAGRETGLPVLVAEDPLTCVVRGCGMALERMERLGSIFTSNKTPAGAWRAPGRHHAARHARPQPAAVLPPGPFGPVEAAAGCRPGHLPDGRGSPLRAHPAPAQRPGHRPAVRVLGLPWPWWAAAPTISAAWTRPGPQPGAGAS
jgi:rod shape-determining protein MreB